MARRSLIGVRYSAAAAREYRAQLKRYAETSPGLDGSFAAAIQQAELLALRNPDGFVCLEERIGIRAVVVRRFPFRLFYTVRGDSVVIAAVAHTSRSLDAILARL